MAGDIVANNEKAQCFRCKRVVYAMEAIVCESKTFHKTCFKCTTCNRTLGLNNYTSHNGEIYCSTHKPREIASRLRPTFEGSNPDLSRVKTIISPFNGTPTAPTPKSANPISNTFHRLRKSFSKGSVSGGLQSDSNPTAPVSPPTESTGITVSPSIQTITPPVAKQADTESILSMNDDKKSILKQRRPSIGQRIMRAFSRGNSMEKLDDPSAITTEDTPQATKAKNRMSGIFRQNSMTESLAHATASSTANAAAEPDTVAATKAKNRLSGLFKRAESVEVIQKDPADTNPALPSQIIPRPQGVRGANTKNRLSGIFKNRVASSTSALLDQSFEPDQSYLEPILYASLTDTSKKPSLTTSPTLTSLTGQASESIPAPDPYVMPLVIRPEENVPVTMLSPLTPKDGAKDVVPIAENDIKVNPKRQSWGLKLGKALSLVIQEPNTGTSPTNSKSPTSPTPTAATGRRRASTVASGTALQPASSTLTIEGLDQSLSKSAENLLGLNGNDGIEMKSGSLSGLNATGVRSRPNVSSESKNSILNALKRPQREPTMSSRIAEAKSAFEAVISKQASENSLKSPIAPRPPGSDSTRSPRIGTIPYTRKEFKPVAASDLALSPTPPHVPSKSSPTPAGYENSQYRTEQLIELQNKIKETTKCLMAELHSFQGIKDKRKLNVSDFMMHFGTLRTSLRKFIDLTNAVVTVVELRRTGIELIKYEKDIEKELSSRSSFNDDFGLLLGSINTNVEFVIRRYTQNEKKFLVKICDHFKEEGVIEGTHPKSEAPVKGYRDYMLEHLPDVHYYRKHFLNTEHSTFIGFLEKQGPCIISLKKEELSESLDDIKISSSRKQLAGTDEQDKHEKSNTWRRTNVSDEGDKSLSWKKGESDIGFRAILRIKEQPERREIILPAQIKKSLLGKVSTRSVLSILHKDLPSTKLKVVEDKSIEQRLVTLDELRWTNRYKFGIILCKPGQVLDNDFLQNCDGSEGYNRFLELIGTRVELKGFKGYAGGLDTLNGRTGTHSIYTQWRDFEIMFHVGTLLPHNPADPQQIDRKRHIGNDVVNIIYLDGDTQFDPSSIRTQFTHIFMIVKEEPSPSNPSAPGYRICITSNNEVPKFGPALPDPSVFYDHEALHDFIIAKLINGENAAYKAPKFAKPHQRTQNAIFDDIVESFSGYKSRSLTRPGSGHRRDDGSISSQSHSSLSGVASPTSVDNAGVNSLRIKPKANLSDASSNPVSAVATSVMNRFLPIGVRSVCEEDWKQLFDIGKNDAESTDALDDKELSPTFSSSNLLQSKIYGGSAYTTHSCPPTSQSGQSQPRQVISPLIAKNSELSPNEPIQLDEHELIAAIAGADFSLPSP